MEYREYIEAIKQQEAIIAKEQLKLVNLKEIFKKEHAFLPNERVKVTKLEWDEINMRDVEKDYYLIIDTTYFDKDRYCFNYRFSYITETGKRSNKKCAVFFHPMMDKIERIK